jgi:hypothetical protein
MEISLETIKQLSKRINWPERRLRNLITSNQIRYVPIGNMYMIPAGAIEEFIERNMVEPCQNNHKGRDSSAEKINQTGLSDLWMKPPQENKKKSQQALKTAQKLKKN